MCCLLPLAFCLLGDTAEFYIAPIMAHVSQAIPKMRPRFAGGGQVVPCATQQAAQLHAAPCLELSGVLGSLAALAATVSTMATW